MDVVYLEEELIISVLSELNNERNKNKLLKTKFGELKEIYGNNLEETNNIFVDLKNQLEEAKVIDETLRIIPAEKENI